MKKNIISLLIIVILFGYLYPSNSFAVANFQSFSVDTSLNSACALSGTVSVAVDPNTTTNGNYFVLIINKIENGNILQNNADNDIPIPLDGVLNDYSFSGSAFSGGGTYDFKIEEKSVAGGQTVSQTNTITETLSASSCANTGTSSSGQNTGSTGSSLSQTPELTEVEIDNPISINSIPELIQKVFEGLIKIGIPLLVVMIVYSGWLYLFARGNPGEIKKAHDMFLYTLIGGAILLAAWALAQLIHSTLIDLTASISKFFV